MIRHTKRMEFDFEQVRKKWTIEYVLEGMAEYYSADLSEKVILPMIVLKCFDDILSPTLPKKPLLKRLKNFKHKV